MKKKVYLMMLMSMSAGAFACPVMAASPVSEAIEAEPWDGVLSSQEEETLEWVSGLLDSDAISAMEPGNSGETLTKLGFEEISVDGEDKPVMEPGDILLADAEDGMDILVFLSEGHFADAVSGTPVLSPEIPDVFYRFVGDPEGADVQADAENVPDGTIESVLVGEPASGVGSNVDADGPADDTAEQADGPVDGQDAPKLVTNGTVYIPSPSGDVEIPVIRIESGIPETESEG